MGVDKLKLQMLQLLVYIVSLLNLCNGMPQFLIRRTYKILVTHPIIPDRKELRVKIETRTRRELYCLELKGAILDCGVHSCRKGIAPRFRWTQFIRPSCQGN